MSDEKPNKVIEPSPLEKWWAEVQEWRAGREKRQVVKRRQKAERFNETRHLRSKRRRRANKLAVIDLFSVVGMVVSLLFGLIGVLFRMSFWLIVIAGIIWFLTAVDVNDLSKDAAKEQAVEAKEKIKDGVGNVIQSLSDEIDKVKKNWHIEIRTHDEEGEEVIMEFGTKKDEPEAPE